MERRNIMATRLLYDLAQTPTDELYEVFSGLGTYGEVADAIADGMLDIDGSVYMGDGVWLLPDGSMQDDEDDD